MRNRLAIIFMSLFAAFAAPAAAQSVESEIKASNGVVIELNADDFANRYEYTTPTIKLPQGFAFVAKIDRPGSTRGLHISGGFVYSGEWRRYSSALYRGGVAADFQSTDRDVVSCRGSRDSGCILSETFRIELPQSAIDKYSANGSLDIQVRAQDASSVMISIPMEHIEAIKEVMAQKKAK